MPTTGVTTQLPTVNGITATLSIPAGAVTQTVTLTVAVSATAPTGFPTLPLFTSAGLYVAIAGGPTQWNAPPQISVPTSELPADAALTSAYWSPLLPGVVPAARRPDVPALSLAAAIATSTTINGSYTVTLPEDQAATGTVALEGTAAPSGSQSGCVIFGANELSICDGPFSFTGSAGTGTISVTTTLTQGSANTCGTTAYSLCGVPTSCASGSIALGSPVVANSEETTFAATLTQAKGSVQCVVPTLVFFESSSTGCSGPCYAVYLYLNAIDFPASAGAGSARSGRVSLSGKRNQSQA